MKIQLNGEVRQREQQVHLLGKPPLPKVAEKMIAEPNTPLYPIMEKHLIDQKTSGVVTVAA